MAVSRAVLITGCSTGIGRATAQRLVRGGWTVYASARRVEALDDLKAEGCHTLQLDVTDEASMRAAVAAVEEAEGAVGVLINNAGYSLSGAIEEVPMEDVRRQFETNFFGLVRLTQLVLPGMRRQRFGKVVNLSSMGGRITLPGNGFYHPTKWAVEALSDVLRFEVAGFGVDVVIIEPGLIHSAYAETAAGSVKVVPGPYAAYNQMVVEQTRATYEGPYGRLGGGPDAVAKAIEKALNSRRPRTRYRVTPSASLFIGVHALLPDRAWEWFVNRGFPRPGR